MSEQNRHTISHAQFLYVGPAYNRGVANNSKRGIPLTPIMQVSLGAPTALSTTRYVNAQAVAGAGAVTQANTTSLSTYGRACQIVSSNAGDTTQTVTITGTDYIGNPMQERISANGTTPVFGKKAFFTVTSVVASAAFAGNLSVGSSDILGLPYGLAGSYDILAKYVDSTLEAISSGTIVAQDATNPATLTTGDVRGTWTPGTATNATRVFRIWYKAVGLDQLGAYGVKQFGDTQVLANV